MIKIAAQTRAARLISFSLAAALFASVIPGITRGHLHPAAAQAAASCDVDTSHLPMDGEEQAVLDQTNAYRASYSLSPLQPSYALTVSAEWKASDMAARHYGAHDDGFRSWDQRFHDCGYNQPGAWMGENLAGGNASGAATLQQWESSPHHNENLLDPNYTVVGIKRMQAGAGDQYGWYWAMELGSDMDVSLYTALQSQGQ